MVEAIETHPLIRRLCRKIRREIPRVPNDRASKQFMEEKGLQELVIDYISWKSRFVVPRPRTWKVNYKVVLNPRWTSSQSGLLALQKAVVSGDNLTTFLSHKPRQQGVSPAGGWSDKDLILNIMGFHHFHLGPPERQYRSHELAFARVSREEFELLAIFNHDVFEYNSAERSKLHDLHTQSVTDGHDGFFLMSNVSTSGHPTSLVLYAMRCAGIIREYTPFLNDQTYLETKIGLPSLEPPERRALEWDLENIDLRLVDKKSGDAFILIKSWQ